MKTDRIRRRRWAFVKASLSLLWPFLNVNHAGTQTVSTNSLAGVGKPSKWQVSSREMAGFILFCALVVDISSPPSQCSWFCDIAQSLLTQSGAAFQDHYCRGQFVKELHHPPWLGAQIPPVE